MLTNDDLDQLLKKHFQQHSTYLDDNGFTALVMSQLPQKTQINPWIKYCILGLPVSLVAFLVMSFVPWLEVIHQIAAFYLATSPQKLMLIGLPLVASVTILSGYYFVLSDNKE